MELVTKYAFAAGIIGLFPLSVVILIPMEIAMVYHLSVVNKRQFRIGELLTICTILLFLSGILHGIAGTIMDMFGPIGWLAKGIVAFVFVVLFGGLVNWYYQMENKKNAPA
jgi:hypothetical protein